MKNVFKHMTSFEIASLGGIWALMSDLNWVLHDVIYNGLSFWYLAIGSGIALGIVVCGYAWYKHHKQHIKHRHAPHMKLKGKPLC